MTATVACTQCGALRAKDCICGPYPNVSLGQWVIPSSWGISWSMFSEIVDAWEKYKEHLIEKYPAEGGKAWEFTCEHHKRIDQILAKCQSANHTPRR